jgi:hypothetical protein
LANSGSAVSASNVVNVNEYLHTIKEGQIKNYIWNAGTAAWVKDPGTVVNISGLQITVDISGDIVWAVGQSGFDVIATVSGDAVTVSGDAVTVSGNAVSISGNAITISGNWVNISGNYLASGQAVTVSGDWVSISGAYLASGQAVTVSGNWINVSGATLLLASGTTYLASGQAVTVSGNDVFAYVSNDLVVTVTSGTTYLASGQAVTVSGDSVFAYVSNDLFVYVSNDLNVYVSNDLVVTVTSGTTYLASGQAVTVSGNWVDVSGSYVTVSGDAVTVSGNWVDVSGATVLTSVSGNWIDVSGSYVTISGDAVTVSGSWIDISGAYIYPRETIVAYTSGMDLTVNTSATFVHIVATTQPSYYEYTAIKIGANASISTNAVTVYLTPADTAAMSGTIITTTTLDSGTYNLYMGIPSATPYYPFALLSGDIVAINIPLTNYITGDAITIRTVLKTV